MAQSDEAESSSRTQEKGRERRRGVEKSGWSECGFQRIWSPLEPRLSTEQTFSQCGEIGHMWTRKQNTET